ncbi:hypothetical protein [Noviherbaspirillum denitrificans]|uniref:Uncharacterized protein n=1 Tax=Noviherbaspirillum denitrificans TaxID=1968433 RepID=A0A254TLF3_9BURK|nr:hypothetical protein [Noviherbaspirillum denitrificans]OWW22152.1 hypothetical protein AYR66_24305 [Noviherbaspirillum denitrificans]
MAIDFTPQFHKRLSRVGGHGVWVAVPYPRTLIPVKTLYYRTWQQEECARLRNAGEEVVTFAVSH